ncbi:hypothetical protein JCM11957_01390 [Caminibacter profundus]
MFKCKITTLSPIHISSGREFELYFNMLRDENFVYLYDEFEIAKFFISKNIEIPSNFNELKKLIERFQKEIINANIHFRKIENNLKITKPLLEQISTASKPIIPGSSIKGAIESAIFDLLVNNSQRVIDIKNVLEKKIFEKDRFSDFRGKAKHTFDKDFKKIFTFLKFSDSYELLKTKIYKTINIKKDKNKQKYREDRVKQISNLVEAISPNQTFFIDFRDISINYFDKNIFHNIGSICNEYYIPKINQDIKFYFYKKGSINTSNLKDLNNNKFILNVGRFGGAEKKSIEKFRYIKRSKAENKTTTSAVTFALEQNVTPPYFENELIPFGWLLCEIIEEKEI